MSGRGETEKSQGRKEGLGGRGREGKGREEYSHLISIDFNHAIAAAHDSNETRWPCLIQ